MTVRDSTWGAMLTLELNASFERWKIFWLRRNHPKFKGVAKNIWTRDDYTCQFCQFQAPSVAFEVINIDQNYQNNKPNNLCTACPLCAQCFFLESIGTGSFGGGSLIYLPELTQNQLNALCHQLFKAIEGNTAYAGTADNILRDLKFRTAEVEKTLGENMSDPARFGMLMLTAHLEKEPLEKLLAPLRLLPLRTRFTQFTQKAIAAASEVGHNEGLEAQSQSVT